MNWFQQNRFLGTFLIGFGIATLAALLQLQERQRVWAPRRALHPQAHDEMPSGPRCANRS